MVPGSAKSNAGGSPRTTTHVSEQARRSRACNLAVNPAGYAAKLPGQPSWGM
jgi:hypothetical protein